MAIKEKKINFDNLNLAPAEQELYDALERGEFVTVSEKEKERYKHVFKAALKKDKRINIRISQMDLNLLKQKAFEEGLPYQTLISSVIHKYLMGRLIENK